MQYLSGVPQYGSHLKWILVFLEVWAGVLWIDTMSVRSACIKETLSHCCKRAMFKMLFLEQIRMSASTGQFKYLQLVVVGLSVYQQPVGLYMTFPITDIVPFKRMVFVLNRQRDIIRQFQNNAVEFFFRQMSASRQFYIFLVLAGQDDFTFHLIASRYSSNVLHTVPLPSSSSCMAFLVVSLGTSSIDN